VYKTYVVGIHEQHTFFSKAAFIRGLKKNVGACTHPVKAGQVFSVGIAEGHAEIGVKQDLAAITRGVKTGVIARLDKKQLLSFDKRQGYPYFSESTLCIMAPNLTSWNLNAFTLRLLRSAVLPI